MSRAAASARAAVRGLTKQGTPWPSRTAMPCDVRLPPSPQTRTGLAAPWATRATFSARFDTAGAGDGRHHGIDAGVTDERGQGLLEQRLAQLRGHVDRIVAGLCVLGQEATERVDGLAREPRQPEAARLQVVGGHDGGAAGGREDTDALRGRPSLAGEKSGDSTS